MVLSLLQNIIMRIISIFLVLALTMLTTISSQGQSLFKDASTLSQRVDDIDGAAYQLGDLMEEMQKIRKGSTTLDSSHAQSRLDSLQQDSIQLGKDLITYSGQILAILDHYRDWTDQESNLTQRIAALHSAFDQEDGLGAILRAIDFKYIQEIDPELEDLNQEFESYQDTVRSASKREKILTLLNSETSVSPLEYVSVSRTLEQYQTPPLPLAKFAEAAAEGSNQNVANGIVNQQALIVGLFTFLVERAQEEVVFTFLNRMLGEKGIQQFREVFPKTSMAFKDLNFTYSESFLERLRQSFYEDVQLLSVSLPSLLTNPEYFQLLESDPIAYNFLQLYTMMAMSQQKVPLEEIIPLTYRNLLDRYEDEKKAVNLKIAGEYHTYTEYQSLSGKTQEILRKLIDVATVLDSYQDGILKEFGALRREPFTVTVENEQVPTIEGGQDSIPPQVRSKISKVNVTGTFAGQAKERLDALYNFLNKKNEAGNAEQIIADIFLELGEFPPTEINRMWRALNLDLSFRSSKETKLLFGQLPADKNGEFLKLLTATASPPNVKKVEELDVLVQLQGHSSRDPFIDQLLAAQPNLRVTKFWFEFEEQPNFFIAGTVPEVIKQALTALAAEKSEDKQQVEIAALLVDNIARLPKANIPLSIGLDTPGEIRLQGTINSFPFDQDALAELEKLSEERPFPADTIPVLAEGYQGLLPILNGNENYSLKMVPSLLKAEFDPPIVRSWSTIETYDKFLRDPLSEQQLRAAGLALTRELAEPWYEDMSIVDMLHQWQADVVEYRNELKRWKALLFPDVQLKEDLQAYIEAKKRLLELIKNTSNHYSKKNANETNAFIVLQNILEDGLYNKEFVEGERDLVTKGQIEITEVEKRLFELNRKLALKAPQKRSTSPVIAYLEEKNRLDALQEVPYQIDDLEFLLGDLQLLLDKLDRRTASQETQALKSISPIVQITETLSHLMYAIKDDSDTTGWINKETLNLALFDPNIEPLFTGLLSQQLGQIRTKGSLSLPGVTSFIKLTVQDLDFVTSKEVTQDSIKLDFFKTAAFVNLTLNRLLELPLFVDQTRPDRTFSLVDKYMDLRPIPDLSDQALEFIYYANVKDHRHAMSSVIRLLTQISEVIEDRNARNALKLDEDIRQLSLDKVMADASVKRINEQLAVQGLKDKALVKGETIDTTGLSAKTQELLSMKKLAMADLNRRSQLLRNKEAEQERKEKKKQKKASKKSKAPDVLAFLRDYGDFMADLIDADTSTDVNALLRSFADPPGSSQEKRRNYVTANLNGYVGVLAGYESLSGGPLKNNESYATFAPTIPVGISFSKLSGEGKKAQSYSLFLSILDLGSLTTYSLDGNVAGESQISFKNVLKPGLQFHWNIKNSPFFLGAGAQLGPQIREFNGTSTQLNSAQFFINFGVDVVVKRLFKLENKPPGKNGGS